VSDKTIRFIDSDYRELFQIPDGASITITYPPDDGRGTLTCPCRYIDEAHVRVGNNDYHICEFAERMEALRAKYEPADQLRGILVVPFSGEERAFFDLRSDAGKTRIGLLSGDFGNQGDRFHAGLHLNEAQTEKNTPVFQFEVHGAVYALRQELLGNRSGMIAYCQAHPEAKLLEDSRFSQYGFKLETETRQYFILCHVPAFERDARFTIYAYEKTAPLREQDRQSVLGQIREAQEKPRVLKDTGEHKHTRSMKEPER
jgi:hypothetical protein